MIKTVKAYSAWSSGIQLPLDPLGQAETDLLQITNIEGLGPVNAAVNTSPLGSMDGDTHIGSSVSYRNIVLTIQPNPNWSTWTFAKLRQLLYTYFMPKRQIRLVFETDEFLPVEIFGYVESNEPQIFSKSGEIQISVICPSPYFTSVNSVLLTGSNTDPGSIVNYTGTVESGFTMQMSRVSGTPFLMRILVRIGEESTPFFTVHAASDSVNYFSMSSVPGQKYVHLVEASSGVITNVLPLIEPGSVWSIFQPGENFVQITTSGANGVQDWALEYYNRYGGL